VNTYEYNNLCGVCDELMLAEDATMERIAIQWLHVIREHPVFLRQYEFLFDDEASFFDKNWRYLKLKFGAKIWGVRQIVRTFFSQKKHKKKITALGSGVDFLFVSHYLNATQADASAKDFYFGDLPSVLASNGATVVIALINQTGRACRLTIEPLKSGGVVRILLPLSLDMVGERFIFDRLRSESRRLIKRAAHSSGLFARVAYWASLHAIDGASRTALRIGTQISELVTALEVKNLVYTHEGHAWERVTNALAKKANPSIVTIAYQHAALSQSQHAVRRKLGNSYSPQIILASNRFAKSEFNSLMPGTHVVELGSPRAINEERSKQCVKLSQDCLVLPEGILSECNILFEFSKRCALLYPNIRFVWRLHPLMSMRMIRLKNPALWFLPPNVIISKKSLRDDACIAKWALYRGSTAVASSVIFGAKPVYLLQEGEISFDPLFQMDGFRRVLKKPEEFAEIFSDHAFDDGSAAALSLCRSLFPVMRASEVAGWLTTKALNHRAVDRGLYGTP